MSGSFKSFVVFAEMRTGSNFLEANLNSFQKITCHGEAFNPHFLGYPHNEPILGVDQNTRDADPRVLLTAIKHQAGAIGGFRYFHDHDPRVFNTIIEDTTCAKIILTRNPVDSYVSWKIAQATGQWKLTDMRAHKAAKVDFDAAEFEAHLEALQAFQVTLMNRLQTSGQTAFYVAYEDLQSVDMMNGIAKYLGVDEALEGLDKNLKKQNPSPIAAKVKDFDGMGQALARLDRFNLTRTPNFEPRRGPVVPSYIAGAKTPLLYLPMKCGPEQQIRRWMLTLDGVEPGSLLSNMSQKDLRQWKRHNKRHRSFTVLRHPVERAHEAFCKHILSVGKSSYIQLRGTLVRRYKMPLPEGGPDAGYDLNAHRNAFMAFLIFLKGNLAGQTAVRVDPAWCSQVQAIAGFGELVLPDRIIREAELESELAQIAKQLGHSDVPPLPAVRATGPFDLADIYNDDIEQLTEQAYQRDYVMFGFDRWR